MARGGHEVPIVAFPSSARGVGSASSAVFPGGCVNGCAVRVQVTNHTATATLDVVVEHSDTGTGGWTTLDTFPQITSVSTVERITPGVSKGFLRITYTVGVAGPETFSVIVGRNPAALLRG